MALKTNYKFLFIGDDKNIFVENYSSNQLFITIGIRNNLSNAKAIGEKIWSTMRRYFSANLNEESYKRFANSLKEVNKVLDKLKGEKSSPHADDLNILIGFFTGKDLYLTQMGDAAAYLARNNSVEVISQGSSEKRGGTFTTVAKGEVEAGDFVVFSSVSLFQYISRVGLAKVLNASALIDSLSELKKLISTKISGKTGIIGMTFEKAPRLIKRAVAVTTLASKPILLSPAKRGGSFTKKPPHKLPAKTKTLKIKIPKTKISKIKVPKIKTKIPKTKIPKFLKNIVNAIKKILLSVRHRKSKLLGIFAVVILVLVLGITWYAKDSALKKTQVFTAVIKGQDIEKVTETITETILDKNVRRVENPKVLVDFSTKQPNINPLGLLVLKDKFFAFEHNKLYEIGFDKIEELAAFEGSETVVSATDFLNQDSLIFTTKSGKLIQYKQGSVTFVKTTDGEFRSGIAIDDWSNRIYILDPDKNQIWRYSYLPSYDIFGPAKRYNANSDLKDAIDLAIDGFIYILHKDASIDKLFGGLKRDFSIQNKPLAEFDTPSKIYTESGLNQIFVMDSSASRIFMYAKDLKTGNAVYSGQIVFPTISDLRDLYVDKNDNKLYLLDAQKVYEVQL